MIKILDLYVIRQFVSTLLFSLFALCIIFIVVNLLESLDNFLDQHATFLIIAKYYIYYLPEILKILTPVAVLLSTLFSIGRLSTQNEITAMKTGGMSLYRLIAPLLVFGIMLSVFQVYFNGWIVPKANTEKYDIERKYLHKSIGTGPINNLFFRDTPTRNILMQYYDADRKTGTDVSIEEYSSELTPRLLQRIEAKSIAWDTILSTWNLSIGVTRTYSGNNVINDKFSTKNINLNITHDRITQLKRMTEEMSFDELWDYIVMLNNGGRDTRRQVIDYYGNYAFPFANFIVIMFAVPFASVRRKGGLAVQVAAAMGITFFYLVFTKLSQTVAYTLELEPILSGWTANIIFFIAGLIVLFKTRT